MGKTVQIGCSSAFWGDTSTAAAQLVESGNIDYLVADYLAEITMSILALKRMRDPKAGYCEDFVQVLAPLLQSIKSQGIRVAANAGGLNPQACRDALAAAAEQAGVDLKIAAVTGDDLLPRQAEFSHCVDMDTGAEMPRGLVTMNAYLGALPVRDALLAGADIVVTGRCADSALVLGPLMAEFGWGEEDYDRLSAGSLAGHIIECGAQCTGGNFTDWEQVPGFDNMGFPIVEVEPDGQFIVTKPEGTGGLVTPLTVGEQLVYEIADPGAYILPDVVCDWTQVRLEAAGEDRVRVAGARGRQPTDQYKVSATYPSGFRSLASFVVGGLDAASKGRAAAEALLKKIGRLLDARGLGGFLQTQVEIVGAEAMYGPHSAASTREVTVRIVATHANRDALKLFGREIAQAATGMVPGITGYSGRPSVTPIVRLFTTLVPKAQISAAIVSDDGEHPVAIPTEFAGDDVSPADAGSGQPPASDAAVSVPLVRLAVARSGDKGDHSNIGVIARDPAYLPYIEQALTAEAVAAYFEHLLAGDVTRWAMPGIGGFNFLLRHSLGGGGVASLRTDPQGKCHAQMLLSYPIPVSAEIASRFD